MLDVLRRNAGSWAIKIILSFIALTFIWWGVGTYTESGRNVAATIAGEPITTMELAEAAANLEKTYREVYGSAFTPELAKTLDLRKQALESLIQRRILLAEADRMGLSATDTEVQSDIAATPAFQADGIFREDRYRTVLSYNRITPKEFEASKRTEITLKKVEGLFAAGALVPETEARELFRAGSRKIRLVIATADPEDARGVEPPTEGEIAAGYEQSRETFRKPARVKLAVAAFTADVFARGFRPTEAEIREYHEKNPDMFRSEEQRLVSRIVLPFGKKEMEASRGKVEGILREASKGKAEFEAQAKKHSRKGGGEAWLTRKDAGPELGAAVFSAPVDTVVGPVETGGTLVIARVNRIRFPETLPLAQVRDRVAAQLARERGKDQAVIQAYDAQRKAAASKDLPATAASFGVPVLQTGWLEADGAAGVPPAVAQEALTLPLHEVAPVKSVGDAHYLFQVVAKEESSVPPLSAVRDRVAAAVAREKRAAAVRAALQQALAASGTAAELAENARKAGLSSTASGWFSPASDPPPGALAEAGEIRKEISSLSRKAPVSAKAYPGKAGRSFGVAFLDEAYPPEEEFARQKVELLKGMAERKKAAMTEAFLSDRRKQYKVEIHPEALK
jgi:peptidyl-prolyl cis-trans isomerase D